MPLQPSRRDTIGPPPRDVSDLAALVRHQGSALRQIEPGLLGGTRATPRPVPPGLSQLVGDDSGDGGDDEILFLNTDTTTAGAGTVTMHLTYEPEDGSETVFWHPNGHGGIRLPRSAWTRESQALTIAAFDGQGAGDMYACEYAYYDGDPEPITPFAVGATEPGTVNGSSTTLTYALPTGTVEGDLLVLSVRGNVATGGGELISGLTCADSRMSLAFTATGVNGFGQTITEVIWVGMATASTSPVVVNIVPRSGFTSAGRGVLASIRGGNGWGALASTESTLTTPTVPAVAAIAVVWKRSNPVSNAAPPTGYTEVAASGSDYNSTNISFWFDAAGPASPSGTFDGEGCCVVEIV